MTTHTHIPNRLVLCATLLIPCLALPTACGDDDDVSVEQLPADGSAAVSGNRYAIASKVVGTDVAQTQATSYLWLVDNLDAGALDVATAIQLPGGATIWGVPQSNLLFVVSAEQLTVTRYALRDDQLVETGKLGLGGAGISSLFGETMVFRDAHAGYLFDLVSQQALELDLSAMTIVRKIDISAASLADAEITSFGDPGFRPHGSRLVSTTYGLSATYDRVTPSSKFVFFNPADGALEVKDAPCGGLFYSTVTPAGDLYVASDPYAAALHYANAASAPAPCMVRLPAGSDQPDATVLDLNAITGAPTGGLIPSADGTALLRVLDAGLYKPDPQVPGPYYAPVWQTYRIQLAQPSAATKTERAPLAGGIKFFEVDGQTFENESTENFTRTALVRTTGTGAPVRTLTMPGVTWGIVRVR